MTDSTAWRGGPAAWQDRRMAQRRSPAPVPAARAVIVHDIHHARAAARAAEALGVTLTLRSAPGAAGYAGAGWFAALVAALRAEFPGADIAASLDCGDAAGDAMAGLACGLTLIRFSGRGRVRARLAALAEAYGAALDGDRRRALDLAGAADAEAACRRWLARGRAKIPPKHLKPARNYV
jgi:hypothetical protein